MHTILKRLNTGSHGIPIPSLEETVMASTAYRWLSSSQYHTTKQESLYSKISPLGSPGVSVKPELDGWVGSGKKVRVAELLRIVHDLRKRKRFSQALEVSEWMKEKGICKFTPSEHAVQLDLIGRVQGFTSAEGYFSTLPDQEKTEKIYGALLNCYVRQRQTEKSLTHLSKMKELGFISSALTYNDIMCLYTNTDNLDKVPEVLSDMKNNNVKPDNYSYRICINSYGKRSDMEGMERVLKEMETQPHIAMDWNTYAVVADFYTKAGLTGKAIDALKKAEVRLDTTEGGMGYNFLITIYTKLGKLEEVLRLWELEKCACKRCINRDYIVVLESLVKLGELGEAKNVLKEWESSGNCYDFRVVNTVIVGLCGKGMLDECKAMLEELKLKGKSTTPSSWAMVASGFVDSGEMSKGLSCMKRAISVNVCGKGWKPNRRVIMTLLEWIGKSGSDPEVSLFLAPLKTVIQVDREMYNALAKARAQTGKGVKKILRKMKADGIVKDEETRKILSSVKDVAKDF